MARLDDSTVGSEAHYLEVAKTLDQTTSTWSLVRGPISEGRRCHPVRQQDVEVECSQASQSARRDNAYVVGRDVPDCEHK